MELKQYITNIRQKIHMNPELSMVEFATAKLIRDELKSFGYKVKTIGTGSFCDCEGIDKKHTIAFRCDIDALPIKEKTNLEYSSHNDNMHACGHDGHTALMLGLARFVKSNIPKVNIRFIFQCGEEGEGGAETLIDAGALKNVDEIYAFHLDPSLPKGKIATTLGAMFAGAVEFDIEFEGVSCHCALEGKEDAIKATSMVLNYLDTLKLKYKNKALFHVGKITAGQARNIVADFARLECTLRFYDIDIREAFIMDLTKVLLETDNMLNTSHKVIVKTVYPPLINTSLGYERIKSKIDIEDCAPRWTAEDFAFYLEKIDGCMMWLGSMDEKFTYPLHSDKFGFDEEVLMIGLDALKKIIY